MSNSKRTRTRTRARSGLFSLSAQVQRRATFRANADSGHEDDGCPICVANRTGGNPLAFFPGPDGSAPAIPTPYLEAEARKAMAQYEPGTDELVPFMEYGSAAPGGGFVHTSFSVDGAGRVFWISPKERRLILELPRAN